MRARLAFRVGSLASVVIVLARCAPARADDQHLVLMREPTPYTDVIDAAERHDRFDLNGHLSYQRTLDRGTLQREQTTAAGARVRSDLADSERVISQLMLGLDIGLYRDLMAFVRVPLVLSDDRSLSPAKGQSPEEIARLLHDPGDFSGGDGLLFELPQTSPTRAGFDYVAFGAAVALTSQERKAWLPTWVLYLEGRRAVGTVMQPCRKGSDDATLCGIDSARDLDGDGKPDGTSGNKAASGVSRGVSALALETRMSKRIRYAEPYMGLGLLIEWPSTARKYFTPGGDLKGYTETAPSRQLSATLGTDLTVWEHRGRYQRVALDARLQGTYYTRGRDYSAVYDALGTSGHAALVRSNVEGVRAGEGDDPTLAPCKSDSDRNCYVGRKVPFYGITDQTGHLRYGARVGVEIRAARYVRFAFGAGLSWVTAYALTAAAPCNLDVHDPARSQASLGQSCGSHPSNPAHRPSIDLPGRRFWMTGELLFDLYASATAQF